MITRPVISVCVAGPALLRDALCALLIAFTDVRLVDDSDKASNAEADKASNAEASPSVLLLLACGQSQKYLSDALRQGLPQPRIPLRIAVVTSGAAQEIAAVCRATTERTHPRAIDRRPPCPPPLLSIYDAPPVLHQGVRAAAAGQAFCSPLLASSLLRVLQAQAAAATLSEREREVACLASSGLSNEEIAARLFIGVTTVKSHLGEAFSKLGIQRRSQLCTSLSVNGFADTPDAAFLFLPK